MTFLISLKRDIHLTFLQELLHSTFSPYTNEFFRVHAGGCMVTGPKGMRGLSQYPDRKQYALDQISIPFGGGVKFAVNQNISLGWEFRFNKTFTDYIDDVSTTLCRQKRFTRCKRRQGQLSWLIGVAKPYTAVPVYPAAGTKRGNPNTKDWYYFSGITLSYRLFAREANYGVGGRGG